MEFNFHDEISLLTLKIKNVKIEKAYQIHIASSLQWYRIAILLGLCMYFSFCIVDYFLFKTMLFDFLKVRIFVVSPLIILTFLLTFWKKYPRYAQWINLASITIGGIGIIMMGFLGRNHPEISRSYAGLVPFFLYIYAFLRIRFIYATLAGTALFIGYSFLEARILFTPSNILIANIFYMGASNIAGMFVAYLLGYQGKKEYLLQCKLKKLSLKDHMTGLYNRYYFKNYCIQDIQEFINKSSNEHSFIRYGILILDIDHFKKINDTYGHDIGDSVIIEFAKILKNNINKTDEVIRWGGEEFLIILKCTQKDQIHSLVTKIGKHIQKHVFTVGHNKQVSINCSIGFISLPFEQENDIGILFKFADQALYKAKSTGRNRAYEAALVDDYLEFIEINWNEREEEGK